MTDDEVRRRCEEFLLTHDSACVPNLMQFYRAVYADGMERAARIAEELMEYPDSSNGAFIVAQVKIRDAIRQVAKEVCDE